MIKKHNIILGFVGCLVVGSVLLLKLIMPTQAAISAPRSIVIEGGDTQYDLRLWWVNPDNSDLDHINICYATSLSNPYGTIIVDGDQALPNKVGTYQVNRLTLDRYYYFYLTAVDKDGNQSVPTEIIKTRTRIGEDITAPLPPNSVTIEPLSYSSLKLSWINSETDDFYKVSVYRSKSVVVNEDATNFVDYYVGLPTEPGSFTDTGLDPDSMYYYRLISEDVKGNKSESVIVSGTTLTPPIAPVDPEPELIDEPSINVPEPPLIIPNNIPPANLFDYRGSFVDQSGVVGTGSDGVLTHIVQAEKGSVIDMWVQFKNTSAYQWWFKDPLDSDSIHEVRLGLTKDANSLFTDNNWISTNRLAKIVEDVLPGEVTTLNFKISIPENLTSGDYKLSVGLVAEWVSWIYDDIHWEIQVS